MNDSLRIHGQGTGFSGFAQRERFRGDIVRFRKGRAAGDAVRGVFLRMEKPGLGWFNLEGEELLAQLPPEDLRPAPGDVVLFVLETLEPEPVLRRLPQRGTLRQSLLPLAQQAAIYSAKRDDLDAILRERLWSPLNAEQPGALYVLEADSIRKTFLDFLARDNDAMDAYALVQLWSESIRVACQSGGLLFFRHMPWLCPAAFGVELALLRSFATGKEDTRILAGLTVPGAGTSDGDAEHEASAPQGRLRFSASPSDDALFYRLLYSADLDECLSAALPGMLREAGGQKMRLVDLDHAPEADSELLAHILAITAEPQALYGSRRFSRTV